MTKQEFDAALNTVMVLAEVVYSADEFQAALEKRGLRIVPAEPVAWLDTTGVYAMTKKVRDLLVQSGAKRKTDLEYSVQCYADPTEN